MASKSSIHISNGHDGYITHNSRESWSQSQVFFDEKNELWNPKEEAFKLYRSELAARSAAYTERTGQRLQKKTTTHLSAIVNLHQGHTLGDMVEIVRKIESDLGTRVFQVAIHRDEGKLIHKESGQKLTSGEQFFCDHKSKKLYFDRDFTEEVNMEEWQSEKNYHAHIEFLGIDQEGNSIRRKLNNHFFRSLQDFTAQSLGMKRGNKSEAYTKEQLKAIRTVLAKQGIEKDNPIYAKSFISVAKELGIYKEKKDHSKRVETHDFKKAKAYQNKTVKIVYEKVIKPNKAKIKNLKAEIKDLREKLKEQGAGREQYAKLEQLNKELHARIKAKNLTIDELKSELNYLYEKFNAVDLKHENEALKALIQELPTQTLQEAYLSLKSEFREYLDISKIKKPKNANIDLSVDDLEEQEHYQENGWDLGI
jgi:uncharacterized coiled-coil protein SlyX